MSLTNAYLHHFDVINHTIKHILQFINSDGACARRRGTFPSSQERAAAGGPGGRVRGLQFKRERNQLALRKSGRFLTKNLGYVVFFPHRTAHFEARGSFYSAQNHFETHQLNNTKYIKKVCEVAFWYLTYTSFVALVALT